MKKFLVGFGVIISVLAGVMLFNTFTFYSLQLDVAPVSDNPVYRKRAIDKLSGAIQIPTISYQDTANINYAQFDSLIAYLASQFPLVHSELDIQRVSRYSLLFRWQGTDTDAAPVLLAGHYDVVPAPDSTEWSYPPFSGRVADGYIWGRGAMDDKIAVIGILEAVEMLLEEGYQPRQTVYLAFGHDEEIGGEQGAAQIAKILDERGDTPDFVLDEGMMITKGIMPGIEKPVAIIGTGEKGYLSLELTATSTAGHSSMPPKQTAIGKLSRAIVNLEDHPFPGRMDAIAGQMFSYVGPEMTFPMRLVMANRWAFDPLLKWQLLQSPSTAALLRTTTAPTILDAGVKDNILPATATGVVNFRILPGDSLESVKARVRNVVVDSTIEMHPIDIETNPRPMASVDSQPFRLLHRTVKQVYEQTVVAPGLLVGTSDGRHYTRLTNNVYSFSPFTVGPEDLSRFHGHNERIGVNTYHEYILYYYQLLKNLNS